MYQGLSHLVEGWSKNVYLGGRRSFPDEPVQRALVPVTLAIAFLFWLLPPAVLIGALVSPGLARLSGAALVACGYSAVFWMLICSGMRIPAVYGFGYPLGALTALYIVLRSTWRGGRKVEWRGRVYGAAGKREKR